MEIQHIAEGAGAAAVIAALGSILRIISQIAVMVTEVRDHVRREKSEKADPDGNPGD